MNKTQAIAQLSATGQPYELQNQLVRNQHCKVFVNAPETLKQLFAQTRSDETFYVYEGERYSFEEMYQGAAKIAAELINHYQIKVGDRVAISMRNYPEWVMAFTAATSIGAIAVAMNALWGAEEMEFGLKDCGAKVLFADQERIDHLSNCSTDFSIDLISVRAEGDGQNINQILAKPTMQMPEVEFGADHDATILYTSGSTGHPKGAVSSHRNVISALFSWELDVQCGQLINNTTAAQLDHQIATLLGVPLFHVAGSHAVLLMSYRAQRKVVAMYKWNVEHAAELIEREKIASFVAPAAMTGDLVRVARQTNRDLSSLLVVGGGGAPRAPDQVKGIDESFKNAIPNTGWGMTETNAIGAGISGPDYLKRPQSSGQSSAVLELAIIDENGNHLNHNQRGELLIRGTSMIRGYWDRPEANASSWVDGWFKTGDVAYLDEDGFLFIVDRIKDLVIRGGENIGCGEVEAALLEHPSILEAAVYGIPDERLGEELGATIYTKQAIDDVQLRQFLQNILARFKIPRYINTTDNSLPRIASGKINKRQLKLNAIANLEQQPA